ncbi:hypothetical protein B005_5355 [Nocardiopsis alba ATCC BAA-2165]|uniref:Uncharacterized protein n=1 Tax=Nocardiopsis alba (strain ATCC BAA-2165 / BE74) TaxID=1205910 RepID=J7L5R6_NOCAA|nr:hypothetical protein B005_5355 [Nocardiopsis alba ATCC BAA-2165]
MALTTGAPGLGGHGGLAGLRGRGRHRGCLRWGRGVPGSRRPHRRPVDTARRRGRCYGYEIRVYRSFEGGAPGPPAPTGSQGCVKAARN